MNIKDIDLDLAVKDGIVTAHLVMPGLKLDAVVDVEKARPAKGADDEAPDGEARRKSPRLLDGFAALLGHYLTQMARDGQDRGLDPIAAPDGPLSAVDEERLGSVAEEVLRLRRAVKAHELEPEQVIDGVLAASKFLDEHNAKLPEDSSDRYDAPIFHLFETKVWGQFIDELLPDAPAYYRRECVRILAEDVVEDESPEAEPTTDASVAEPQPMPIDSVKAAVQAGTTSDLTDVASKFGATTDGGGR